MKLINHGRPVGSSKYMMIKKVCYEKIEIESSFIDDCCF
jgi:hypothetical protein